jgi:predicted molibdopterin-dependent oxidoreductase YjgC
LITGRSLYQFNAGTMTGRTRNTELRPSDVLDMASADAARLGLGDGQSVRVASRYGAATLPVCISAALTPGQLFATFQTPGGLLNAVTGPNRDARVGTPEYKVTAVQVELANEENVQRPGEFHAESDTGTPAGRSGRPTGAGASRRSRPGSRVAHIIKRQG